MITKLDFTVADPAAIHSILSKPCCADGNPTYECPVHFLTESLKTQVYENLSCDRTGSAAKILAEVAKYDTCREFLADENIISILVANLSSLESEFLTQSCRALANLCYEMEYKTPVWGAIYTACNVHGSLTDSAQKMVVSKGGLDAVICILKSKQESNSESTKQMRAAALGLLINLINDNADAHTKIQSSGLPYNLIDYARAELDTNQVTVLSQHVILVLVILTETIPMDVLFTLPVCKVAIDLLAVYKEPDRSVAALEFLEEASVPDSVKLRLVEAELFDFLVSRLEGQPKNSTDEEAAMYELMGKVLANMLGGDEAMEYVCKKGQPALLNKFGEWLKCEEFNKAYCSTLCIGNIARTDAHSKEIVERGLHRDTAKLLHKDTCDMKMQHAVLSTLRNLAIPKENKQRLVADGILDTILPLTSLDIVNAAQVIFKLVGTLRQLVDGQQAVASRLGQNKQLLERLVHWSDDALCPWVSSEALRLLCSLVTLSKERNVAEKLLEVKALGEMSKLLTCEHTVMQMEAVNALTVGGACLVGVASDMESALVETSVGEKIKLLLMFPTLIPELLENVLTMLEILVKYDKLKTHLRDVELLPVLETIVTSKEAFSSLRPKLQNIKNLF